MTYEEWFSSKQGEPYDSMYVFAKDAWQACYASRDDEVAEFQRQLEGHRLAWKNFGEERAELKRQRDELLSALEGVEKRCAGYGFVGLDGQFLKTVRAAIASVKGAS